MPRSAVVCLLLLLVPAVASADAGMWTFNDFPADLVKREYGADISSAWLDRVRSATVRLANCTASFVSPDGLMLTNHHCAEACLDDHSSAGHNLMRDGFLAGSRAQELRCDAQIADVLMETENITAKVTAALQGLSGQAANAARRKTLTQLEQACEDDSRHGRSGPLKCESVDLYQGAQYWLYKYRRYDDVRLVFAPESDIAAFGGDPDNFEFPRWCLDMSLLRAYGPEGKPAATPSFLSFRPEGPNAGEVVFVAGHPGSTDRMLTVAQLETQRDVVLPSWLLRAEELRGRYIEFGKMSAENHRIVENSLDGLENAIKVRHGELDALLDERLLQQKRAEEAQLRARIAANAQLASATGDPWADIGRAQQHERELYLPYAFLEEEGAFNSRLFNYARALLRAGVERPKPNIERLREYSDQQLARDRQRLFAPVPVYPELEKLELSFGLERMREWLGPDAPIVRQLLAKDSPDTLAARVVDGTHLADPHVRRQLWDGGAAAVDAAHDPMIELARSVDAESRAVRKRHEDEVDSPEEAAAEKIAQARFAIYGTSVPPDATFTLRLNFGTVRGWRENGREIAPFTHLSGLFERAADQEPFRVPDSWTALRGQLDMSTRFNLSSSNDIVGGNSGSPLIDRDGRLVGLVFDGNIQSLAGSYWYDGELNRAVSLDPAVIVVALRRVYRADALLAEMGLH